MTNEQSARLETLARIDELTGLLMRILDGLPIDVNYLRQRIEILRNTL